MEVTHGTGGLQSPVQNIVDRLQAKPNGNGWTARCPAHEDRTPSLTISEGAAGRVLIHCHAGCTSENVLAAIGLKQADLFPARYPRQSGNGDRPTVTVTAQPAEFDWQKCNKACTDQDCEKIANERGYSPDFVKELRDDGRIGIFQNCIAFPVGNNGSNVGAHYRAKEWDWAYTPRGIKTTPLVFGELQTGDTVHIFESQWDGLAFMDKSGERTGVICTRGASNGKLVADLIPDNAKVYVWPQNDDPGTKWERDVCAHTKAVVKRAKIPVPHKDLNDWTRAGATEDDLISAIVDAELLRERPRPLIEFRSPKQLKGFVPPPGIVLVGDNHIVRGSVFVIGGAPGIGKSRASVALAEAGATGYEWFGLPVRKFKTMIVQAENGEFRLSKEFAELNCDMLEDYVRICPPPPYGLCFGNEDFRKQLADRIGEFGTEVLVVDPWNAVARDEKAREYLETFDLIRSVLPPGDAAPAIGILAHTRKPKMDERASGRALLNLLAGSYVLGSVPRTVFVMQAATDDTTDNRIVWTCCKNNDGELGKRSAWERRNGLFAPVTDFDWGAFDAPEKDRREVITEADMAAIFENGPLTKSEAREALEEATGAKRSTCYYALDLNGRFKRHLSYPGGKLTWK
jgi:AAA domain-containing protein